MTCGPTISRTFTDVSSDSWRSGTESLELFRLSGSTLDMSARLPLHDIAASMSIAPTAAPPVAPTIAALDATLSVGVDPVATRGKTPPPADSAAYSKGSLSICIANAKSALVTPGGVRS